VRTDSPNAGLGRRDLLLGGAGFLGAFLLLLLLPRAPRVQQPIQFNHQKHLSAGLECSDCHTLYATTPWAGLPKLDACTQCHQEVATGTPEESKLLQFVKGNKPLPWKQVNQLPAHVYFSHQTHAVSAGIACATCHGDMKQRTVPPTRPLFAWRMNTCLGCHAQRGASQDCDGCHR
jgi:Class III cytochrome C family/Cytochrome c7 and related cytochrome c